MDFENQRKNYEKTFFFKKNRNITISFFLKKNYTQLLEHLWKNAKETKQKWKRKENERKKKDLKLVNYSYVL